jgi:hypothetical protein
MPNLGFLVNDWLLLILCAVSLFFVSLFFVWKLMTLSSNMLTLWLEQRENPDTEMAHGIGPWTASEEPGDGLFAVESTAVTRPVTKAQNPGRAEPRTDGAKQSRDGSN